MPRRRKPRKAWTLENVVAEIARLDALGKDLDPLRLSKEGHADLIAGARKHAGSWRNACLLAGAFDRQGRERWSRQKIIARLRRLKAEGRHMSMGALRRNGFYDVAHASISHFGTWGAACKAAGLPVRKGNSIWTRELILSELRRLAAQGIVMRQHRLRVAGHGSLVDGACTNLGGWKRALRLAGIPEPPPPGRWSRELVIETIRARHARGESISSSVLEREEGGRALMAAAVKHCGSWVKAVTLAGLTPAGAPYRTKEKVTEELRRLAILGMRMSATALIKAGHGGLVAAARRRYGTWPAALRTAEIASPSLRWSKQLVIETIRARNERGDSLSSRDLKYEKGGRGLMHAATKFCGGWVRAVKLAGLTPASSPTWRKQKVIEELRRLASSGLWMSTSALEKAGHRNVAGAAQRCYGTWAAALRGAGIPRPKGRKPRSRLG